MMNKNIISFAALGIILLVGIQAQPVYAQSFFDDFTNIFSNLQSYFEDVFSSNENNKQDVDVFRALGETISDWTDDFDEEKKLLKEQNIQNEIELEKRQKELEKRERQLQAETLAKQQKQREADAERLDKEQKQRDLNQRQQQLDAERLAKEQKQRELEEQQRLVEAERLAKEQKQRELEERQRQLEAERLAKEQKQRELERQRIETDKKTILSQYSWSPFIMGLTDGELTYYVQRLPSYASKDVRERVESLASWMDGKTMYGGITLKRVYQNSYADFSINWVKDYQEEAIGRQVGDYLIVGLGMDNCFGDWMPFTGLTVYRIMWHEVGHALGYAHVKDPNNIMYEGGTGTKFSIAYEDRITLDDGGWTQIPLCYGGEFVYSVEKTSGSGGFYTYVVPPNANGYDIVQRKASFYLDCSEYNQEMRTYTEVCTVPRGSSLLIENPTTLGMGSSIVIDVEIYDRNPPKNLSMDFDESHMYFTTDFMNLVKTLFRYS